MGNPAGSVIISEGCEAWALGNPEAFIRIYHIPCFYVCMQVYMNMYTYIYIYIYMYRYIYIYVYISNLHIPKHNRKKCHISQNVDAI